MVQVAFFDIDGVLSIPQYMYDGKLRAGYPKDEWVQFNQDHYAYEHCKVPYPVYQRVKMLREIGVPLYVLSTEKQNSVKFNKQQFVLRNYAKFFDIQCILFVDDKTKKVPCLLSYCKLKNIQPGNVYFVDDNLDIIFAALDAGIDAHHVSEFFESVRILPEDNTYIRTC